MPRCHFVTVYILKVTIPFLLSFYHFRRRHHPTDTNSHQMSLYCSHIVITINAAFESIENLDKLEFLISTVTSLSH